MKKLHYGCLLILIFALSAKGQPIAFEKDNPTNNTFLQSFHLPSPNAAALGKYSSLGINQFSGNLDFSIPIYTIKSHGVELPISLVYANNGLKVTEEDSYVGHGWTLLAGGVISRAVRGAPDGPSQLLDILAFPLPFSYTAREGAYSYINTALLNGTIDPEPDLYMLRVGKLSVQFFFDNYGRIQTVPYNNAIRISFNGTTTFTVVDEEGNTYLFGSANDNETSTCLSTMNPQYAPYTSAWYLTTITTFTGNTITFQNAKGVTPIIQDHYTEYEEIRPTGQTTDCNPGTESKTINYPGYYITPVFLKSITTDKEIVYFNRMNAARADLPGDTALSNIRVYSIITGKYDYNYSFSYSYFPQVSTTCWGNGQFPAHPHNVTAECKRLKLDQFIDRGNDINSSTGKVYSFSYSPKSVPSRCSRDQDFWGYYNGAGNSTSMLPAVDDPDFQTYAKANSREADPSYSDAGMLQKIVYPTGGQTEITYEPNVFPTLTTDPGYTTVPASLSGINPSLTATATFTITSTQPVNVKFTLADPNLPDQGLQRKVEIINSNGDIEYLSTNTNSATEGQLVYGRSSFGPFSNGLVPGTYTLKISRNYVYSDYPSVPATAISASVTYQGSASSTVVNRTVGGFRVRKIVDKTENGSAELGIKEFTYDDAFLVANIQKNDCVSTFIRGYIRPVSVTYHCTVKGRSVTASQPIGTVQGSHIGYGRVTCWYGGNGAKGRTEYNYSLGSDEGGYSMQPLYRPISSHDFERGLLLSSYDFDAAGVMKHSLFNEYEFIPKYIVGFHFPYHTLDDPIPDGEATVTGLPFKVFAFLDYNIFSEWVRMKSSSETFFDLSGHRSNLKSFYYNNPNNLAKTEDRTSDSKGNVVSAYTKYPMDYKPTTISCKEEIERKFDADVVTKFNTFVTCTSSSNGNSSALDACYSAYSNDVNALKTARNAALSGYSTSFTNLANSTADPVLKGYYQMIAKNKLSAETEVKMVKNQTQELSKVTTTYKDFGTGLMLPETVNTSFNGASIDNEVTFNIYGANGNLWQKTSRREGVESYTYDYHSNHVVGVATNGQYSDIAYISFEDNGRGNWTFNGSPVRDVTTITGVNAWDLQRGSITKSVTASTTYFVTFWRPSSLAALAITGTVAGYPITGRTVNGWKYYEYKITGQTTVTLSGSGKIDELRLYPVGAQFTTVTYDPLKGITSKCDANNLVTYYSYDAMNRLVMIRDQDRNIVKKFCYSYAGQAENCTIYGNNLQTIAFKRTTCTSCNIGGYYNYTVPAGQYYSSISQADADQQAIDEANGNGQGQADLNGPCTVPTTISCLATNGISGKSFSVQFYNVCLGTTTSFTINSGSSNTPLAGLKQGTYNVAFNVVGGGSTAYTYRVDGMTLHATSGTISSVVMESSSNTLVITP